MERWIVLTLSIICTALGQQELPCTEFEVRLVQTTTLLTGNSGRLEICRNGTWGSIQGPSNSLGFWPMKNVQVACRWLGYAGGLNSIPAAGLTLTQQTVPPSRVHYGDVLCDGSEMNFQQCQFSSSPQQDHTRDVHIACLPNAESYSDLHTLAVNQSFLPGDLRLVGSTVNGRGAVEIFTSQNQFATICPDDNWNNDVAQRICQNLGYDSGVVQNFELESSSVFPRVLSGTECESRGGVFRIQAGMCTFLGITSSSCPARDNVYAGVNCRTESADESVRLFGATMQDNRAIGTVEILFNGRWGLLCRPLVVSEVAESVCSGLGYPREGAMLSATPSPSVYRTTESRLKPVWVPHLTCTDTDNSLGDCSLISPIGYGNCPNGDLLLVNCSDPPYRLPDYGIALLVLTGVGILAIIIWYFAHGKMCWANRRSSQWYPKWKRRLNNLKNCWGCCSSCSAWFKSCCNSNDRVRAIRPHSRTVEQQPQAAPSPAPAPAAPPQPQPTPPQPQPTVSQPEPIAPELTKAAPPNYDTASGLPGRNEELPPPYPGSPGFGPSAAFPPMPPPPGEIYPPNAAYPPPTFPQN